MFTRTQLLLDTKIKKDIEYISKKTGKSISHVVRKYLLEGVNKDKKMLSKKKSSKEMLMSIKNIAVKGPKDSRYDEYLY